MMQALAGPSQSPTMCMEYASPATPSYPSPGIQHITKSLRRYRLRLALATSVVMTWAHHANSTAASEVESSKRGNMAAYMSALDTTRIGHVTPAASSHTRRGSPFTRRYPRSIRNFSTSPEPFEGAAPAIRSPAADSGHTQDSPPPATKKDEKLLDISDIGALMRDPALLSSIKKPRLPIVLCHGLYGFDVRGPFWGLEIHYWASVLDILRKKVGAEVIVRGVPGTGAIADRAQELHNFLRSPESGVRGKKVNFVAHSMGGLDVRYIISVLKPTPEEYTPVSLTTVSTPHRGSPFMDWCNANVGTGQDRVEAEIREAKKRLGGQRSTTEQMKEASEAADEQVKKLPFSLKTPLFVRPQKDKATAEGENTKEGVGVLDAVKTASEGIVDQAAKLSATPGLNTLGNEDAAQSSSPSSTSSSSAASTPSSQSEPSLAPSSSHPSTSPTNASTAKEKSQGESSGKKKHDAGAFLNFKAFNKALSSIGGSFSSYMLGVLDQPAYAMLSTRYMSQVFNPTAPNSPDVAYFSVAARKRSLPVWHPLWLPKLVLDAAAESRSTGGERDGSGDALGSELQGNDGLVSVESAKWGTFLGVIDGCDHWDLRGGGAPRWRGRINPATGKPWPEESGKDEEKKSDRSWLDLNTVLGKLLNRDKEAKASPPSSSDKVDEAKKGDGSTPSTSKSNSEEEGVLDEVASWISDRLPQGDAERRAEAERVADEHDRKSTSYRDASRREDTIIEEQDKNNLEGSHTKCEEARKLAMARTTVKLRRDAAWQEELGHDEAARELRRELAWHRAEWDRYSAARVASNGNGDPVKPPRPYPTNQRELDWDRHSKQKSEANKKPEEANELERFWIALCHHLWQRGF